MKRKTLIGETPLELGLVRRAAVIMWGLWTRERQMQCSKMREL